MITQEKETVFDYEVSFVGNDISIHVTITEETNDVDHDIIVARAEKMVCEIWGVKEIPQQYPIVNVDVYETEI
jgi:hypothetical protein